MVYICKMQPDTIKQHLEEDHKDYYSWALHCCGEDRELVQDVLQNAYLKILEKQHTYKAQAAFKTWAFAIIKHTALDARKKARREKGRFGSGLYLMEDIEQPERISPSDDKLKQQFFSAALRLLSERQREIFQLLFYHDLTLKEAAMVLHISTGAASRHYDRAKKRLVVWFREKGININNYNGVI